MSLELYASAFAVAVANSFMPVVSVELFFVAATVAVGPVATLPAVPIAALGQAGGKLPIYWATRGAAALPGRHRKAVERVHAWAERARRCPHVVLGSSALLGIPPFSLSATAAGLLLIRVWTFCAIVVAGRAARFAAIVAATSLY